MIRKILLLFAVTITVSYAQQVRGIDLHTSAKDTVNAIIGRSPGFTLDANSKAVVSSSFLADSLVAADTTALKLRKGASDGAMIYLTGLSGSNANGGGWFVYGDSAYIEGIISYTTPVAGKQWVRYEYLTSNEVYDSWGATLQKVTNSLSPNDKLIVYNNHTLYDTLKITTDSIIIDLRESTITGSGISKLIYIVGDTTGGDTTTLQTDAKEGTDSLIVYFPDNFAVGDWIYIYDPEWSEPFIDTRDPGNKSDVNYIRKIEGNILILGYPTMFPFGSDSTIITKADIRNNINIIGGNIVGDWDVGGSDSRGVYSKFSCNIKFDNVYFEKWKWGLFAEDVRLFDLDESEINYVYIGYEVYRGLNCSVTNSKIRMAQIASMAFNNGSRRPRATGNELLHAALTNGATNIGASGIVLQYSEGGLIANNDIYGIGKKLNYGISVNTVSPFTVISNNTVVGSNQDGIISARAKHVSITGNSLRDGVGQAIALETSIYSTVTNNTIKNYGNGIKIICNPGYYSVIANNIIEDIEYYGILMEHDGTERVGTDTLSVGFVGYKNSIHDNKFRDVWRFIQLEDSVWGTSIYGNTIDTLGQTNNFSSFISTNDTAITGDGYFISQEYDLSGAGDTTVVFYPSQSIHIISVSTFYTESTSADAGCRYTVGRITAAGLDVDYYFADSTKSSVAAGFQKVYHHSDTTGITGGVKLSVSREIKSGTGIVITCEGNKTGTGKMIVKVNYIRM